jgi:hypothetical protein
MNHPTHTQTRIAYYLIHVSFRSLVTFASYQSARQIMLSPAKTTVCRRQVYQRQRTNGKQWRLSNCPVNRIALVLSLSSLKDRGSYGLTIYDVHTAEPRSCMRALSHGLVCKANRSETVDTEQFRHLIRIRPVLWDISCKTHSNKTKKQAAWLEVCKHKTQPSASSFTTNPMEGE